MAIPEWPIDFVGQHRAELVFKAILILFAAVGFLVGYVLQNFGVTAYFVLAGAVVSALAVVPPWPYLRRHPLKWLPTPEQRKTAATSATAVAGAADGH
eukprot:m51a1_g8128 putative signal peptidase complex subunit 1 (98) ;mRNA; r:207020-207511